MSKLQFFYVNFILDTLWVEVTVESEMTMALVEQLAALPVPSSNGQVCVLIEIYYLSSGKLLMIKHLYIPIV